MEYKELLEEIRLNRKEIQEVKNELSLFKGKSMGFLGVMSFVFSSIVSVAIDLFRRS